MLVRADHRGLATMTGLLHRHLRPAKTVLVDMGAHSPTRCRPELFPDADVVRYDDLLAGGYDWTPFLDGLDWVYTAEIPYDFGLFEQARARGVRTLLHVMPELDPYVREPRLPRPDVLALPTGWLRDRYPDDTPVLPVPAEPWVAPRGNLAVHPGSLAMRDRNGTRIVMEASRRTTWPVVVRTQAPVDHPHYRATVDVADRDDPRDLLAGAGVVVLPRRYGGLSLVAQEARAAGLPLLVPTRDPYAATAHPEAILGSTEGPGLQTKGGRVPTVLVTPKELSRRLERLAGDPVLLDDLAAASRAWAEANTWERVRPAWDNVLT